MAYSALVTTGILASSGSSFSVVTQGMTNLMGLVTTMLTAITSNDILATFFVAGFAGVAIGILSRLKNA